ARQGALRANRIFAKLGCEAFVVTAVGRGRRRGEPTTFAPVTAKGGAARNDHHRKQRVRAGVRRTRPASDEPVLSRRTDCLTSVLRSSYRRLTLPGQVEEVHPTSTSS